MAPRTPYTIAMAQTKHEIQSLLAEAGAGPRHRFGQNFMIDHNLLRRVAEAGEVEEGDVVIEVGPGTGTLTEELLARGAHVLAVEIDRDLAALLRRRLGSQDRFTLIEGDALANKHRLNAELARVIAERLRQGRRPKLVANLPYNIASPLIIDLLIAGVGLLAFTVQKEVAERLRAPAGTEEYGMLSVMAQLLSDVELLRILPPQAFWPAPKIDSALVRMRRNDRLQGRSEAFNAFLQTLFSARRKMIRKSLTQGGFDAEPLLAATGLDGQARPEEISPEKLWRLFEAAEKKGHEGRDGSAVSECGGS